MNKLLTITTEADLSLELINEAAINNNWEAFTLFYSQSLDEIANAVKNYNPSHIYLRDPFNKGFVDKDLTHKLEYFINLKNVISVDNISEIADIYFEDKWFQYQLLAEYMPNTVLPVSKQPCPIEGKKIYKKRISSRAKGISFEVPANLDDYIIQEALSIKKEYRVISVNKNIVKTVAIKESKNKDQKVRIIEFEEISIALKDYVEKLDTLHKFQIVGYDVAELDDGAFKLIELNRSPQFKVFSKRTGINVFELYLRD